MKRIRIGNDIDIQWTITTKDGEPYNLEGKELRLFYSTFLGETEVREFTVQGNTLLWTFHGKDQQQMGAYTLTLVENQGSEGMMTVDACEAFTFARRSCAAGGDGGCGSVTVETVELATVADIMQLRPIIPEIGDNGNWRVNGTDTGKPSRGEKGDKGEKGDPFLYEDFTPGQIEGLQKPATDAAEELEDLGVELRQLSGTVTAQESLRVQAENQRNTTFDTLKQQSETATANANAATNKADTAAGKADASATKADAATKKAETAAANANREATNANEAATLARQAKELLFRDLWNQACGKFGKYNEVTGFYELNGLTDITYGEAMLIYQYYSEPTKEVDDNHSFQSSLIRSNIPYNSLKEPMNLRNNMFDSSGYLEVVRLCKGNSISVYGGDYGNFMGRSAKIRAWLDVVSWFGNTTFNNNKNTFKFDGFGWTENHPFHHFRFSGTNLNVDCRFFPNIDLESFQYLVDNRMPLSATGANPFTVTVHPAVYAKLMDETNTEWHALMLAAIEKQISFATVE